MFSAPSLSKSDFSNAVSLYGQTDVCASLEPEWLGFIDIVSGIQEFIHRRSMSGKCEKSSYNNKRLSEEAQNKKWQFSRKWLNDFIKFRQFMKTYT